MPRTNQRPGYQKRSARADHPYQDRGHQRNNYIGKNVAGLAEQQDDSLYRHEFLHEGNRRRQAEAATTAIVSAHAAFELAQEADADGGAAAQKKTLDEAAPGCNDWWVDLVLKDSLEEYISSYASKGGGDNNGQGKQEESEEDIDEEKEDENGEFPQSGGSNQEDHPGPFDVVCGRGISADRWPGNLHFRRIVGEYTEAYANAPNNRSKKQVTIEVLSRIKNSGRFLKEDDHTGRWFEMDDEAVRSKVGQQLRYQMRNANETT